MCNADQYRSMCDQISRIDWEVFWINAGNLIRHWSILIGIDYWSSVSWVIWCCDVRKQKSGMIRRDKIQCCFMQHPSIFIDREAKGDNTFGHVRPSARPSVCLSVYALTYRITTRWSSQRAFKLVALSKCLLFQNGRALGGRSPF